MTPLAGPLVHNTILGGESYTKAVQWKYHRLWHGTVERNDVVVFNWPNGDTVMKDHPEEDYYMACAREGGRDAVLPEFLLSNLR